MPNPLKEKIILSESWHQADDTAQKCRCANCCTPKELVHTSQPVCKDYLFCCPYISQPLMQKIRVFGRANAPAGSSQFNQNGSIASDGTCKLFFTLSIFLTILKRPYGENIGTCYFLSLSGSDQTVLLNQFSSDLRSLKQGLSKYW